MIRHLQLRPELTLTAIYRMMGWTESAAYQARKFPDLRTRILGQLARIVCPDNPGAFMWEVVEEMGLPPVGQRIIVKPRLFQMNRSRYADARKCSACGRAGHRSGSDKCHLSRPLSVEARLMSAKAVASPVEPKKPRGV